MAQRFSTVACSADVHGLVIFSFFIASHNTLNDP